MTVQSHGVALSNGIVWVVCVTHLSSDVPGPATAAAPPAMPPAARLLSCRRRARLRPRAAGHATCHVPPATPRPGPEKYENTSDAPPTAA